MRSWYIFPTRRLISRHPHEYPDLLIRCLIKCPFIQRFKVELGLFPNTGGKVINTTLIVVKLDEYHVKCDVVEDFLCVYVRERALRGGREVGFAALLGSAIVAILTHKATQFLCERRKIVGIGLDIEIKAI